MNEVVSVSWRYDVIDTTDAERFANSLEEYVNDGWETIHVNTVLNERDDITYIAVVRIGVT